LGGKKKDFWQTQGQKNQTTQEKDGSEKKNEKKKIF